MGKRTDIQELWTGTAENIVWGVAISKEAEFVAAGSWDNYVYFFDKTGQLLWKNKTSDYVKSVALSKTGELIVAGSYDKNVYAFNKNGRLIWRYKAENYVRGVSVNDGGDLIAAGSWNGTLYLLDKKGGLLWKKELGSPILSVSISGNGDRIVAACEDRRVYAVSKGEKLLWRYEAESNVMSVAVSENGESIVVGYGDKYVCMLDKNGTLVWKTEAGSSIKSVAVSSDGRSVIACASDKHVYSIDKDGKLQWLHKTKFDPWDIACSGTGAFFAVSTKNGTVNFFENRYAYKQSQEAIKQKLSSARILGIDTTRAEDVLRDGEALATQHEMEKAMAQLGASEAMLENAIIDKQSKAAESSFAAIDAKMRSTKDKRESMRLSRILARARGMASSRAYMKAIDYIDGLNLDLELPPDTDGPKMQAEPVKAGTQSAEHRTTGTSPEEAQVVQAEPQATQTQDVPTVAPQDKPAERIVIKPRTFLKVLLDYPKDNETITSTNYTIKAHTSDDADTQGVAIRIDNGEWSQAVKGPDGLWAYDWNGITSGEHQVTVKGISKAGRSAETNYKMVANIPVDKGSKPVCPGCARAIDLRWNLCPYCHTKLGARCTKCTSKLEPDGSCMYCNVQAQLQGLENDVLAIAARGVNVDGARVLLRKAMELHNARDFTNAVQSATDALTNAKAAQVAHTEIMGIIDSAKNDLDSAKNDGKDVAKASSEHDAVMLALQKGDVDGAKAHALEFQRLAKEAAESKGQAGVVIKIGVKAGPICPTCGKRVNERWKLCPYCKTKLK